MVPAGGIIIERRTRDSRGLIADTVVARDKLTLAELPGGPLGARGRPDGHPAACARRTFPVVPVRGSAVSTQSYASRALDAVVPGGARTPSAGALRRDPPRSSTQRASSRPQHKRALAVECHWTSHWPRAQCSRHSTTPGRGRAHNRRTRSAGEARGPVAPSARSGRWRKSAPIRRSSR